MAAEPISVKAVVDKKSNRIIFVESNEEFVDILFSFLTMPLGTIVRLTRNQPPSFGIGCLNNLYESVENLDVMYLRTKECKTMLLNPRNCATTLCQNLELKVEGDENIKYFYCYSCCRSVSYYRNTSCSCGGTINQEIVLFEPSVALIKELSRFLISEDLQVMPASTAASLHLISKFGLKNARAIQVTTFEIGQEEVLNLLKGLLVSKTPLTEIFLQPRADSQSSKSHLDQSWHLIEKLNESNEKEKICVKLILSKSKNIVCYAEVGEDFIDLLFSFLAIPLGYVAKEMLGCPSQSCLNRLYRCVLDLDAEKYFSSNDHKETLLSPKIAPCFGIENQELDIEEVNQQYYRTMPSGRYNYVLKIGRPEPHSNGMSLMDPKSPSDEITNGGGFLIGPAMFMVTDDLIITPVSPVSGLLVLYKLKVSFTDIEERVVQVGKEEALHLLVASVFSKSALTDVFLPKEQHELINLQSDGICCL